MLHMWANDGRYTMLDRAELIDKGPQSIDSRFALQLGVLERALRT